MSEDEEEETKLLARSNGNPNDGGDHIVQPHQSAARDATQWRVSLCIFLYTCGSSAVTQLLPKVRGSQTGL